MKSALIVFSLSFLAACMPTKSVVPKSTGGNINASAPFLWSDSAFPIDLKISNDFSNSEVTNIQDMSTSWETAIENKQNFFNHTERTPEVSAPNMDLDAIGEDGISGVYKVTHWPLSLSTGALAVTQLLGTRYNVGASNEYVRIIFADILINENIYDFRTDGAAGSTYDLRTVVLHELGHFLGLAHKYGDTVMIPAIGSSTEARAPTSVDATDMASKYGITLGGSIPALMAQNAVRSPYIPRDEGEKVKILIELMADGECVHKENGAIIKRHSIRDN